MADIQQGSIELENETLDTEDIETAYEQDMDDDVYQSPEEMTPNVSPEQTQQNV
jgi:hypothetical protein